MKKTPGGQNDFAGDVTKDVGRPSKVFCHTAKNPSTQKKSFCDMKKCFCDVTGGFFHAARGFFAAKK